MAKMSSKNVPPTNYEPRPICCERHCDGRQLEPDSWEVVKNSVADAVLQVNLAEPKSGYKVRAYAPFPVPVWVCTKCGRVEKPTDALAWAAAFVAQGGRSPRPGHSHQEDK